MNKKQNHEPGNITVDCDNATINVFLVETKEEKSCRVFFERETGNYYVEKFPQRDEEDMIYVSCAGNSFERAEQLATENVGKAERGVDFSSMAHLRNPDDEAPGKINSIDGMNY